MVRKICPIGNSYGISIPKEILKKLHLTPGVHVEVKLDEEENKIIIEPAVTKMRYKTVNAEFVSQVNDFIRHYKPALKTIAEWFRKYSKMD
jgi:putative addiction module antidote